LETELRKMINDGIVVPARFWLVIPVRLIDKKGWRKTAHHGFSTFKTTGRFVAYTNE
jgi:hypothetical protein